MKYFSKVSSESCSSMAKVSLRQRRWTSLKSVQSFAYLILMYTNRTNYHACAFLPEKNRPRKMSRFHSKLCNTEDMKSRLESMTVKDLRHILKSNTDLNKRGVITRLKLKKDLVEYLHQNLSPAFFNSDSRMKNRNLTIPVSMPKAAETGKDSVMKKNDMFERIYQQYPSLRDPGFTSRLGEGDVRQLHHPIFEGEQNRLTGDMDIVFVGTASCTPGVSRGVSCTALRLNWNRRSIQGVPGGVSEPSSIGFSGGTWLFDAGECTQLQIQKTVSVRPGKITKIFITHAHGDHSFGLPGLLCLMGQDRDRQSSAPVDIYGPEGLRMWLRVAIRYSVSRIVPNYRVHELKDIPIAPEWEYSERANRYVYRGLNGKRDSRWGFRGLAGEDRTSWISQADKMLLQPSRLFGEVDGGRDIFPTYDHPRSSDGAPVWEVEDEEDVKVFAAPMSHSIPCVGYVVEESSRPGRLRSEIVTPIVKRNIDALKEAGFNIPMKALAVIKNLPVGSSFSFPDGTVVTQEEAVEPPRNGRKVVICGDTASSRALEGLAQNADVVIHEATNSYVSGIDRDTDLQAVTRDAIVHGHSTPVMAGQFAKRVNAKKMIMNHFSSRYRGDVSVENLSIMARLEEQAINSSGLAANCVAASWDFMVLPVRSTKQ